MAGILAMVKILVQHYFRGNVAKTLVFVYALSFFFVISNNQS
jgi:hypothetical protein